MRVGDRGEVGREDGGAAICVAPVKGATRSEAGNAGYADISIHTSVKGAT